ncbi:MAG: VirB10 protein [Pseudomonadota bacterium]|jgi:type IV secretion system protein VirB10
MLDETKQEPQIGSNSNSSGASSAMPEVLEEVSKVGSNPKKNIVILIGMALIFAIVVYNLVASQIIEPQSREVNTPLQTTQAVSKPATTQDVPTVPQLPEPPKLVDPAPPPAAPEPSVATKTSSPTTESAPASEVPLPPSSPATIPSDLPSEVIRERSDDAQKRIEAKRKSSIVLVGGTENTKTEQQLEQEKDFTKRGNLEYVLGQGKIIDAVIESAVNTDSGGEVRAVISRDVFSENGKVVLIPRGSRVFGSYTSAVSGSSARIDISWNRINLDSGYTLNIKSDAVDNLGRKGIEGRLDRKYVEQMSNAVLLSAFNIAVATGLDKLVPPVASTATASQTASGVTQLIGLATNIATDNTNYPTASTKITAICGQGTPLITDTGSTTYVELIKICAESNASLAATPPQNQGLVVSNLVSRISALATTSATSAAQAATPTQKQQASKQAFSDIGDTAKNMLGQTTFKPTITLDQGTQVKIYVNKDYVFPRAAVNKAKVLQ